MSERKAKTLAREKLAALQPKARASRSKSKKTVTEDRLSAAECTSEDRSSDGRPNRDTEARVVAMSNATNSGSTTNSAQTTVAISIFTPITHPV